jgi:hypothetical protein
MPINGDAARAFRAPVCVRQARCVDASSCAPPRADFSPQPDTEANALVMCADTYQLAISYLSDIGFESLVTDNASRFTRDYVIGALERDLGAVHGALREAYLHNAEIPRDEILRMYRRLPWTFACEISSFQRKRYVNLSHEPNKAVNLNSCIGLISGAYR